MQVSDQSWKNTKLSLERPYKDDSGNPIQALLDITPDSQFIYEPREDRDTRLGELFRRIFVERGLDFFDTDPHTRYLSEPEKADTKGFVTTCNGKNTPIEDADEKVTDTTGATKVMTPERLFQMRSEIIPRLHIALGEMSHARDLLSLLLSASNSGASNPTMSVEPSILGAPSAPPSTTLNSALKPGLLTTSRVSAPLPILSVQAFNAQLVTGGKDDALRKGSDVLRTAAEGIDRSASRSEQYWADALRIRRGNWELVPAPLPLDAPTGKGADKTSRDFLISYGLESSPPIFRRHAIAHMSFYSMAQSQDSQLVFPHRDHSRLRVSLTSKTSSGDTSTCHSQIRITSDDTLNDAFRAAQMEVVEKEIFAELIREAGNLPTASARVSERLIVIDAAQDVELRFGLIDEDLAASSNESAAFSPDLTGHAVCDLIASSLPVFLLRLHAYMKAVRLKLMPKHASGVPRVIPAPQILKPIVDLLQYHVFLNRIHGELMRAVSKLRDAGVPVDLRLEPVGETGKAVLNALLEGRGKIGGEAILKIDRRHTVRLTFTSPSTLTALLPQARIPIATIPQLLQLLADEIERSLLEEVCAIGIEMCQSLNGTWFVDEMMSRAVGRWEGCVLNFRVKCGEDLSLDCHAHQLLRAPPPPSVSAAGGGRGTSGMPQFSPSVPSTSMGPTKLLKYAEREDNNVGLFAWVKHVIEGTLSDS